MKLNLRQQRALHEVADKAGRQGGSHAKSMRDGTTYVAERHGAFPFHVVRWRVIDAAGKIVLKGEY